MIFVWGGVYILCICIHAFGITTQEHILMMNLLHLISEKNVSLASTVTVVTVLTILFKYRYNRFEFFQYYAYDSALLPLEIYS